MKTLVILPLLLSVSAHAADYATCGADDTVALQALVNANSTINLTCMASVQTVNMSGTGKKISATNGGIKAILDGYTILITNCTDCSVSGLVFDGGTVSSSGIVAADNIRLKIEANRFSSFGGIAAIYAVRNTDNIYRGNVVSGSRNTARGIWLGNNGSETNPDTEIGPAVENNSITSTAATGIVCTCVNATINDNYVADTKGAGIALSAGVWSPARNIAVMRNVLLRNQYHGLQSDSWTSRAVSISIHDNVMEGNGHSGIYAANAERWTIVNNRIANNGPLSPMAGINFESCDTMLASGNTIRNDNGLQTFDVKIGPKATNVRVIQ